MKRYLKEFFDTFTKLKLGQRCRKNFCINKWITAQIDYNPSHWKFQHYFSIKSVLNPTTKILSKSYQNPTKILPILKKSCSNFNEISMKLCVSRDKHNPFHSFTKLMPQIKHKEIHKQKILLAILKHYKRKNSLENFWVHESEKITKNSFLQWSKNKRQSCYHIVFFLLSQTHVHMLCNLNDT